MTVDRERDPYDAAQDITRRLVNWYFSEYPRQAENARECDAAERRQKARVQRAADILRSEVYGHDKRHSTTVRRYDRDGGASGGAGSVEYKANSEQFGVDVEFKWISQELAEKMLRLYMEAVNHEDNNQT